MLLPKFVAILCNENSMLVVSYVVATYSEAIIRDYNKMLLCTVTEHVERSLF